MKKGQKKGKMKADPLTFRPEDDVRQLILAGLEATGKSFSELMNDCIRGALLGVADSTAKAREEGMKKLRRLKSDEE